MGQSQQSHDKPKDFISNFHTKNLDDNLKDYSSYKGVRSNHTQSLDASSPTLETSIRSHGTSMNESRDLVEVIFEWMNVNGGSEVFVTGSFTNWKSWFKLEKTEDRYIRKILLPREKHYFKFIVDKDWKPSSAYAQETDDKGNINNVIDLTTTATDSKTKREKETTPKTILKNSKRKVTHVLLNDSYSELIPERTALNTIAPLVPCLYNSVFNINKSSLLTKVKSVYNNDEKYELVEFYSNCNSSHMPIAIPSHINM